MWKVRCFLACMAPVRRDFRISRWRGACRFSAMQCRRTRDDDGAIRVHLKEKDMRSRCCILPQTRETSPCRSSTPFQSCQIAFPTRNAVTSKHLTYLLLGLPDCAFESIVLLRGAHMLLETVLFSSPSPLTKRAETPQEKLGGSFEASCVLFDVLVGRQ